jgi:hypothetical protein
LEEKMGGKNDPRGFHFVKVELKEMYRRGMPKKGKKKSERYPGDQLPERWRLYILYLLICVELLIAGKPWPPDPFGLIPRVQGQGKYSTRGRPRTTPEEPEDVPMEPLELLMKKMGGDDGIPDSTSPASGG